MRGGGSRGDGGGGDGLATVGYHGGGACGERPHHYCWRYQRLLAWLNLHRLP